MAASRLDQNHRGRLRFDDENSFDREETTLVVSVQVSLLKASPNFCAIAWLKVHRIILDSIWKATNGPAIATRALVVIEKRLQIIRFGRLARRQNRFPWLSRMQLAGGYF
jgi:hypothetical protein